MHSTPHFWLLQHTNPLLYSLNLIYEAVDKCILIYLFLISKICFQTNSQLFNSGMQSLKNYILYKKLQIRILYRLFIFINIQYDKQLYVALF